MDIDVTVADRLLTTTRTVRKRLDFDREVGPEVLEKCIEIAMQAPTGSNQQHWHFMVVTDPEKKMVVGDCYKRGYYPYREMKDEDPPAYAPDDPRAQRAPLIRDSATYLAENMHRAPALVIACCDGRVENEGVTAQASMYGSILPAAWSLMLALRARGLGAAWTTLHLPNEKEVAELLGIPENITQAVLMPVAYYTGEGFRPAKRLPARQMIYWNSWKATR